MLVNGTKLGYATSSGSAYTDLAGLKEVPDMGAEPELVDNTALSDSIIHNELGIGDAGDMEYTFRFVNTSGSAYRNLKAREGVLTWFKHELNDPLTGAGTHHGTQYTFSGYPSVRISGGGVNDPQEFVLTIALQSDITITDPA